MRILEHKLHKFHLPLSFKVPCTPPGLWVCPAKWNPTSELGMCRLFHCATKVGSRVSYLLEEPFVFTCEAVDVLRLSLRSRVMALFNLLNVSATFVSTHATNHAQHRHPISILFCTGHALCASAEHLWPAKQEASAMKPAGLQTQCCVTGTSATKKFGL